MRTPKANDQSKFWRALQTTGWETGIGLACMVAGIAAFIDRPAIQTFLLGSLLVWQAGLYLAAPVYSLLSVGASSPERPFLQPRRTVRENWAARFALAMAVLVVGIGVLAQVAPPPPIQPSYSQYQPPEIPPARLFGLERVPIEERSFTPTPAPALPTVTPIVVTSAPLWTPTLGPTGTLPATPTISPSSTPLGDTPIPTATPLATSTVTAPPPTETFAPTVTPLATDPISTPSTPGVTATPSSTGLPTPTITSIVGTTIP